MGVKVLLEERITGIESIDELISKRDWTSAYVEASKKRQDINNQNDLKTLEKLRILYNNTKGFTDINVEQQQELKDLLSTTNN